jgi:hypothetical protein
MRNAWVCLFLAIWPAGVWAKKPPKELPQKLSVKGVDPQSAKQTVLIVFSAQIADKAAILAWNNWALDVYEDPPPAISGQHGDNTPCMFDQMPVILRGAGEKSWNVSGADKDGKPCTAINAGISSKAKQDQTSIAKIQSHFSVTLALPDVLTAKITSMVVSVNGVQGFYQAPTPKSQMPLFQAATRKSDADNYLSGLYSPAIHSAAQYNIDAQGSFIYPIRGRQRTEGASAALDKSYLGAIGTMSTNNRPTADPDSYFVSPVLDRIVTSKPYWHCRGQGVLLVWNLAGVEFDRKTTTKTVISSPVFEVPYFFHTKKMMELDSKVVFYAGLQTGSNVSNALNRSGSGFVLRGLAGSSVGFTINPKWKYLSQVAVKSNYTARVPATDEIFTYTQYISATGKTVNLPVLSHQVRNHVKTEIDFTVYKPFSITLKHEYGELPPGFRVVHNAVSIQLTVALMEKYSTFGTVNPEN